MQRAWRLATQNISAAKAMESGRGDPYTMLADLKAFP
jgi:hypothetical protein